jgi:hypothetical protein
MWVPVVELVLLVAALAIGWLLACRAIGRRAKQSAAYYTALFKSDGSILRATVAGLIMLLAVIGLLDSCSLVAVGSAAILNPTPVIIVNEKDRVFYTPEATMADARDAAKILKDAGYFGSAQGKDVSLEKTSIGHEISFVTDQHALTGRFSQLAEELAEDQWARLE